MKTPSKIQLQRDSRFRRGFTLTEILVAIAILMVLLLIMLVPMNLGLTMTQIGRARASTQAAAQASLSQMEKELRSAVYVFPNSQLPGVTDRSPFTQTSTPFNGLPYIQVEGTTNLYSSFSQGVCKVTSPSNTTSFMVSNTSRLDFILPQTQNGIVSTPLENADYLVTYYARRLYVNVTPDGYYDEVDNPIVLMRAQVPYRDVSNATITNADGSANALLNNTRYTSGCGDSINRGTRWLTQNTYAEPNLEPLATDAGNVVGSHTLLTPRGMGMVAPFADELIDPAKRSFQPTTSFTCYDANSDGKIDRVTINLELYQYDAGGAAAKAQRVRVPLSVDLPNIR